MDRHDHPYSKDLLVSNGASYNTDSQYNNVLTISEIETTSQIEELYAIARDVGLIEPLNISSFDGCTASSSVDTTNTVSSSNECGRIANIPKVTVLENDSSLINGEIIGTWPFVIADNPVLDAASDILDLPIGQSQTSADAKQHLSSYTGMFSVEQHFVCLVCCRPTCFKTDTALVIHLRVHISEQTIKVKKQSEETPDNQMDEIQENSGENSKVSTCSIVMDSDSDANTEIVCDDSKNTDDVISRPMEWSQSGSKGHNGFSELADLAKPQTSCCLSTKPLSGSDHKCSVCQSNFTDYIDLQTHLKLHNNSKEDSCYDTNALLPSDCESNYNTDIHVPRTMTLSDKIDKILSENAAIVGGFKKCKTRFVKIGSNRQPQRIQNATKTDTMCPSMSQNNQLDIIDSAVLCQKPTNKPAKHRNHETDRADGCTQAHVCETCGKILTNRSQYNRHFNRIHGLKSHSCDKCDKTFSIPSQLKKHLLRHNDTRAFLCHFCPKAFFSRSALARHIKLHATGRTYACTKCSYQTTNNHYLRRHMWRHTDNNYEKYVSCSICDKVFKEPANLRYHMTVHTGERRLKCDSCSRQFHYPAQLTKHKQCKHNANGRTVSKPFTCNQCYKTFEKRYHLQVHLHTHLKEKPYSCPSCGIKFISTYRLQRHRRVVHCDIKPFTCTVCEKGYFLSKELIKHMKTHSIEDPQPCVVCKQYFSEGELSKHILTHEKEYCCSECVESFYVQSDLTEHLRIHFGDKPHICHICEQRFHIFAHLLVHMQRHSD